jgi:ribonuclease R
MINANVCAAPSRKVERRPCTGFTRRRMPRRPSSCVRRWPLPACGSAAPRSPPKLVHDALAELGDRPDRWIFEMLALRSMNQAMYSPENKGHYGLALDRYMHFTSPIRRYADLVVHRAIKAVLNGEPARASATTGWLPPASTSP